MHEHSGRYRHVAEYLTQHEYAVRTFDLRGHGKSGGKRGYTPSFDHFLDDLEIFLNRVREWQSDTPQFLLGHSMGGGIVALYVISRAPKLTGVLLSGAALKESEDLPPMLIRISGLLGKLLPKLATIKIDSNYVSSDPQVVENYKSDPLNYTGGVIARTGAELIRALREIQSAMESFSLPVLILHGTFDRLTDPEGSVQLYNRAASTDKELKLYNGFYHEILNDDKIETKKEKSLVSGVRSTYSWLNGENKILYSKITEDNPNSYNVHDIYI